MLCFFRYNFLKYNIRWFWFREFIQIPFDHLKAVSYFCCFFVLPLTYILGLLDVHYTIHEAVSEKQWYQNTNNITEIKNFVIICYSSPSCSCSSLVIVSSHLHWFYFSMKSLVLHFNYTYKLKFSLESEPLVLIAQCAVSFTFRDRISCCEGYLIWNMHCMFNIAFLFCTSRCFAYLLYTSPAVCL